MSWNYRVVKRTFTTDQGVETVFGIHEVYYDGDGKPKMCTVDSVGIVGDAFEELKEVLSMFAGAFEKPVLDYDQFNSKEGRNG